MATARAAAVAAAAPPRLRRAAWRPPGTRRDLGGPPSSASSSRRHRLFPPHSPTRRSVAHLPSTRARQCPARRESAVAYDVPARALFITVINTGAFDRPPVDEECHLRSASTRPLRLSTLAVTTPHRLGPRTKCENDENSRTHTFVRIDCTRYGYDRTQNP